MILFQKIWKKKKIQVFKVLKDMESQIPPNIMQIFLKVYRLNKEPSIKKIVYLIWKNLKDNFTERQIDSEETSVINQDEANKNQNSTTNNSFENQNNEAIKENIINYLNSIDTEPVNILMPKNIESIHTLPPNALVNTSSSKYTNKLFTYIVNNKLLIKCKTKFLYSDSILLDNPSADK